MRDEAVAEIKRRYNILLENATPGDPETSMNGSRIYFCMALALIGYPLGNPPEWMDEEYKKPVLTNEEFSSDEYNELIIELFNNAFYTINPVSN